MLVEDFVLLELKVARVLERPNHPQLLTTCATNEVGIFVNFGLKPEFKRLVLDNASKTNRCGN